MKSAAIAAELLGTSSSQAPLAVQCTRERFQSPKGRCSVRILVDDDVPEAVKKHLKEHHTVKTVREMGWSGPFEQKIPSRSGSVSKEGYDSVASAILRGRVARFDVFVTANIDAVARAEVRFGSRSQFPLRVEVIAERADPGRVKPTFADLDRRLSEVAKQVEKEPPRPLTAEHWKAARGELRMRPPEPEAVATARKEATKAVESIERLAGEPMEKQFKKDLIASASQSLLADRVETWERKEHPPKIEKPTTSPQPKKPEQEHGFDR
jgi:hypothetical protein